MRRVTPQDVRRGNYVEALLDRYPQCLTSYRVFVQHEPVDSGLTYTEAVVELRARLDDRPTVEITGRTN